MTDTTIEARITEQGLIDIKCISPINGEVYGTRQAHDKGAAMDLITKARRAQAVWAGKPLSTRITLVMEGIDKLVSDPAKAAEMIAWMMGRPVHQFGEFGGCVERATYMAEIAERALAPDVIECNEAFDRRIEREPLGVVLVVAPWNYPFLTSLNTIVPALIAGNSVVMKHAAQTLLVGEYIQGAFEQAGLPKGVLQNVYLDHVTTSALISDAQFDFVNFTGSVAGGQAVEHAAAGTFIGVGTELGGKDPAYVMEDAEIDVAVASLMDGAFYNSGQCCCGIERIYVHEVVYEEFVQKASDAVKALKLGNPLDTATTIGPMANIRFAQEVRDQIGDALDNGARSLIPAELFPEDDGGAYLAPQVLVDVNHNMRVMRDESFGPVVGIMKVSTDDEAVALMNDSEFGLTASLWTQNSSRAGEVGQKIEAGTIFMNRCDYLDPAICWSGCKNTGRGMTLSVLGYQNLTRPKSYHFKRTV